MGYLKSFFAFSWDIIKVAAIALVLAGLVRYFLVQPFFVEISYYFKSVERGEVIVFHYPLDTSKYYIKRVVGLPNETVEIKNGKVTIYNDENSSGFFISENYLLLDDITVGDVKKKLGRDEYFVLGDNRLASSDSRQWGILPKNDIVGRDR